jgi:hypothetical protein
MKPEPHFCVVTSLLHRAVEGPVADDRMSSFPPACCCWQGACREGLRRRGGRGRGRGPGGPSAGRVARHSGPAPALAPFPVPGRSSLWTVSCWSRGLDWRMHESVEDTKLSTNKQHSLWGGWLVLLLRGCDVCRAVSGAIGGRPHRRPPRCRVSPDLFFLADCDGL